MLASRSQEICGNHSAITSPRSLPLAWLGEEVLPRSLGASAGSGGSPGTAGKAQAAAPAQFSLTAS